MPKEDFLIDELRHPVLSGHSNSEEWRRVQLKRIRDMVKENEKEIINALKNDLEKPSTEAFFEVIAILQELKVAETNLKAWMRPQKIEVPLSLKPGSATIKLEPLGCALIIGPWNYPFSLTIQPLISALAAGNTAVIKPSEHALNTSELIAKIIPKYFPKNVVQVIQGDGYIAKELISKSFDHIFFTGGSEVGKKVMQAAANHLTPVTLELGGKSPAIILEGTNIEIAAKRIIWGKGLNSGQTCIAPDHILIKEELYKPLVKSMKSTISYFYGNQPLQSKNLGKIINKHHFKRLKALLENAKIKNQVIYGGDIDENRNRISPTLINIEDRNDPLMEEEIFGPLIPILKFQKLEKLLTEIRENPKPLAMYIFGGSILEQEKIINTTSSGSLCINDVVLQAGIPELPFGGVGASGMGRYHGYSGFETFSNKKTIFKKPFWLDLNFRYPPYKLDPSLLKRLIS